jgi:tetratricopeptide (TPR) repeat protein
MRFTPLVFLFLTGTAQAQVSVSAGNDLARSCYTAALTSTYSKMAAGDGIGNCNAALAGPLSAKDRAATFDNRGILFEAKRNYSDAWDDFNRSIKLNEKLGDAWINRGVARIRLNQPEDALTDIQKGMSLGPAMLQIGYYDLGVAEESLGKLTDAYNDFKRSLAVDPEFTPASDELKNFVVARAPASSQPGQ